MAGSLVTIEDLDSRLRGCQAIRVRVFSCFALGLFAAASAIDSLTADSPIPLADGGVRPLKEARCVEISRCFMAIDAGVVQFDGISVRVKTVDTDKSEPGLQVGAGVFFAEGIDTSVNLRFDDAPRAIDALRRSRGTTIRLSPRDATIGRDVLIATHLATQAGRSVVLAPHRLRPGKRARPVEAATRRL